MWVYRLGCARTRAMARHLVTHGHVLINNERLTILSLGDTVTVREAVRRIPGVEAEIASGRPIPSVVRTNVLLWTSAPAAPTRAHPTPDLREDMIVEFYSRGHSIPT
jgi:small subunit ribosomal protein S4